MTPMILFLHWQKILSRKDTWDLLQIDWACILFLAVLVG